MADRAVAVYLLGEDARGQSCSPALSYTFAILLTRLKDSNFVSYQGRYPGGAIKPIHRKPVPQCNNAARQPSMLGTF